MNRQNKNLSCIILTCGLLLVIVLLGVWIYNLFTLDDPNFPAAPVDKSFLKLADYTSEDRFFLQSVEISRDGNLLAVGAEGKVFIWDLISRKQINTLDTSLNRPVLNLVWSPDNKSLAIALQGERIEVWETQNWTRSKIVDSPFPAAPPESKYSGSNRLAYTSDGALLATFIDKDGILYLWSVQNKALIRNLGHSEDSFVFSRDGRFVAAVDTPLNKPEEYITTLKVWTTDKGDEVWTKVFNEKIPSYVCEVVPNCWKLAIDPVKHLLAYSTAYGTIQIWDISTDKLKFNIEAYKYASGSIFFSQDGETLASLSDTTFGYDFTQGDSFIKLWNIKDGTIIKKLKGGWPREISLNSKTQTLVSIVGSTLQLWKYK